MYFEKLKRTRNNHVSAIGMQQMDWETGCNELFERGIMNCQDIQIFLELKFIGLCSRRNIGG